MDLVILVGDAEVVGQIWGLDCPSVWGRKSLKCVRKIKDFGGPGQDAPRDLPESEGNFCKIQTDAMLSICMCVTELDIVPGNGWRIYGDPFFKR